MACARQAVDTDDGSAFYKTYENFFVYAANGLKSDFNGRSNEHYRNVYGYVDSCWGPSRPWLHTGESNVFSDNWCVANAADGGFASDCDKPEGVVVSRNQVFNRDGHLAANPNPNPNPNPHQVFNRDGHFAAGFKLCDASNSVAAVPSDSTLVAWGLGILEGVLPPVPTAPVVEQVPAACA